MAEVIPFDEDLERRIKEEFGDEATPEFINLLRACKAAYEHGFHEFISKEKFLEFISMVYDGGKIQADIRQGKAHGDIIINGGDVFNIGSYLSFWGEKEGYLSGKREEETSEAAQADKAFVPLLSR